MKHTQGKWLIENNDNVWSTIEIKPETPDIFWPCSKQPHLICSLKAPSKNISEEIENGHRVIKYNRDSHGEYVFKRNLANARLIIAAPDLLDACERMRQALLDTKLPVSMIPEIAYTAQFVNSAINKAKGAI